MSVASTGLARDRQFADLLFVVQIGCAIAFGIGQYLAMQSSVEGVSTSWFVFWVAFLIVNLVLAINGHRAYESRVSRQTVVIYAVWTVVCGVDLIALLLAEASRWNHVDTTTAIITLGGSFIAILLGRRRGLPISDPMVRASIAVFCKAMPQLTLAWNIWENGGSGISIVAFTAGHVTIGTRLWQIGLSIREAGWDRNRLGMAIGEAANEASWIVTTAVWVAVR